MTKDEMEEMADLAVDICEEGIEVSLKSGDLTKVFVAVVVANVVSYIVLGGISVFLKEKTAKSKNKSSKKDPK
jgi:hypothetical protein